MNVNILTSVPKDEWNSAVMQSGAGSVFQTTFWGDYYKAYLEAVPRYVTVTQGHAVLARLLVLQMPAGAESLLAGSRRKLRRIVAPLLRSLSWREGPLLYDAVNRATVLDAILEALSECAKNQRALEIARSFLPLDLKDRSLTQVFAGRGYRVSHAATVRVNLRQPLDTIWNGFKHGVARTPIRKAENQGVQVREVRTIEDLRHYYTLVQAWRRLNRARPYPWEKFSLMFEHLRDQTAVFLAEVDKTPVAGAGLWHFAGRAHFFTPAQSPASRERRIYAGDYLVWQMIRWCHERNMETFDLSGVNPSASGKEAGIRRFKEKWGGEFIEYDEFALTLRGWHRVLLDRIQNAWHRVAS